MIVLPCQFHGGRRDEGGALVFCGARSVSLSSYCETHRRIIFVTLAQMRARADTRPLGIHQQRGAEHA
jgi:hypothetical protein